MPQWIALFLLLLPLSLWAQEENLAELNPMEARAFILKKSLKPGDLTDLQVELNLQEGFFAYEERFRLKVVDPEDIQTGELFIEPIVEFDDTFSKKKKRGVAEKATLKTQLDLPESLPAGVTQLAMELTYIACTKKFCLTPRTLPLQVEVEVQEGVKALTATGRIQKQIDENLAYALIMIFIFGVLTSLTPCVYPLIPITLAVLGASGQTSQLRAFFVSLSYVLGIAITYAILGVIAAQTGQLFGALISHPTVIITMSVLFFLMGLSLLGLFQLQPPAIIRNRFQNSQQKGIVGAFVAGLLAGVVASPCVGPVLVGILAYIAKSQNAFLGFWLLFTFAMGFGMLFIALGTFSHLTQKLPRSGAWMNLVKTLLALVLFALSFYYLSPLIKKYWPQQKSEMTSEKGLKWESYSDKKVKEAIEAKQPVIIDFYADWCVACVEMEQLTFTKASVIEKSHKFKMLKVDATTPSKEINEWQKKYEVYGLPTMIFIDVNGEVREDLTLTGFEGAQGFVERMQKALKANSESP